MKQFNIIGNKFRFKMNQREAIMKLNHKLWSILGGYLNESHNFRKEKLIKKKI